jgi:hypothetical protein
MSARNVLALAVFASVSIVLPLSGSVPLARADEPRRDEKAADVLFQSAKAALERGDLGAACAQFAESQRLDPAAGTLLNLGECEERAGKLASALGHIKEARTVLPAGDYRIPFADARITGLARRVPRLALRLAGPPLLGAVVACDDHEVAPAALEQPLPVDPGAHTCVLRAPGHPDGRAEVTLREGETQTLELRPGTTGAVVVPPQPEPHAADTPHPDTSKPPGEERVQPPAPAPGAGSRAGGSAFPQRTLGLAMGGAGAASVVVGVIFGLVAKGTYDGALSKYCKGVSSDCTQPGVSGGQSAHDQATVSTATFLVGGALLAGAAILYLTAPKAGRVEVAPTVGSSGAGLSLAGAW